MTDNIPTSPRDRAVVALVAAAGVEQDADAWRDYIADAIARAVEAEQENCAQRIEALMTAIADAIRNRGEADG